MQTKDQEENLKKLFLLAQKGDSEAYAEFLGILSGLLRGYLTKTMTLKSRSLEVVEDLVQDTLLAIHRKRHLHDSTRPILPWIYVIARHRLIDSIRADARRPELVEWVEKFDAEAFVEIPRLLEEEEGEHWMEGLNAKQKTILRLAKVEELSLQEVALKQGMTVSAVKVTIHRAIRTIRKNLQGKAP